MKSIQVEDNDWKWMQRIRVNNNFKTMADVVTMVVSHAAESIIQGDLEFITQDSDKKLGKTKEVKKKSLSSSSL